MTQIITGFGFILLGFAVVGLNQKIEQWIDKGDIQLGKRFPFLNAQKIILAIGFILIIIGGSILMKDRPYSWMF